MPTVVVVSTIIFPYRTVAPVKVTGPSLVEILVYRLMVPPVTASALTLVTAPWNLTEAAPARTVRAVLPATVLVKSTAPLVPAVAPVPPRVSSVILAPRVTASVNVRAPPVPPAPPTPVPPVTVMLPLR